MKTTWANRWLDFGHEVKVSKTHISRSSDFALYLDDYWIMRQYDLTCDLRINVGHCDLYFMVQ